jgi:hypothetical protein
MRVGNFKKISSSWEKVIKRKEGYNDREMRDTTMPVRWIINEQLVS